MVWAASGREYLGTLVAGWTGRWFAVVVVLLALLPVLLGHPDVIWLAWGLLLAGFIWFEASRSLKYGRVMSRASPILRSPTSCDRHCLVIARHAVGDRARAAPRRRARPSWSPMRTAPWQGSSARRPRTPSPLSGARGYRCPRSR